MSVKENFRNLLQSRGFRSVNKFSKATGIDGPNIHANMKGKNLTSIARLFIYADTLGVPVDTVIEVFYPEEMKMNREAVEKFQINE